MARLIAFNLLTESGGLEPDTAEQIFCRAEVRGITSTSDI
jgi:hypothetical protein